ncbi:MULTISPECIES: ABC transporter ATP-binding protein [Pontibacillus]|uniref:ATP-binding cassette domain-containing protein n=1 Tax=Pontibacillus chungwhensis TaxID=265426 RepID=A0ABY8V1A0_9BACI|nr:MULTISPECIES: oligopeptide/dipeptide ABC transporter ATP-binding protein [Pontibacillus]MCD5322269.1 ATP-binding cassette domain-containing protein [Pontibacillus sp. HN14]WIF99562.1 ATP-binding cassette domain-containing protein [Pontibacillus chungwhensis]
MSEPLLKVEGLKKHFVSQKGFSKSSKQVVKAVDGISFDIKPGETFGLVGESGCGKSTTGRMIMRMLEETEGTITFDGQRMDQLSGRELKKARKDFQMIFQDPYASLNPRMTVRDIIAEPLIVHEMETENGIDARVYELLDTVGLPRKVAGRYPHEFSGGQRQRIGIARALAVRPKLIIADEPVSALDVSIQSQVLNLLKDLQDEFDLTYLFIAHDLSVVDFISDRIGVMYLGKLVEVGDRESIIQNPQHPYTRALLSAVPVPDPRAKRERIVLEGDLPSPSNPPSGCPFHTRCPFAWERCVNETPQLQTAETTGHTAACHLLD